MWRFIVFRLLQAIPVLLVVITVTFFLIRMAPGGPFDSEKAVIPEVKAALEAQYRLNLTLFEQYTAYLGDLSHGDLGPSFKYPGRSVNELIAAGFPVTAELALYALLVALVIGGVAGVVASLKPNTAQDYIRTARAKGLPEWQVVGRHALRGGMIPVVAFLGPAFAGLLSGSFVVETIFQIPGLGRFYVQAAFNRDYTMILGSTVFLATLIVVFNLLSDILAAWMNPRLRDQIRAL